MHKTISILGTEYQIIEAGYKDDPALIEYSGYCDKTSRKIVLSIEPPPDSMAAEEQNVDRKATLRHELVHAFFFESGHARWGNDEDLVDWIAWQLPKMVAAMNEASCL